MAETFKCKLCDYDTADRKDKAIDSKTEMSIHLVVVHELNPNKPFQKPKNVTLKKKHFWE